MAPVENAAVFFTSGGSESIETAAKLARRYWDVLGRPEKRVIVSRQHAYHGMAAFGTSLGGIPLNSAGYGTLVGDIVHVGVHDLDALEALFAARSAEIAAFIAEPVIGAGGVIPPQDGYFAGVQQLCRQFDVLLIADEVITGFGRTGSWWGSQRYDIQPDLITFAKGVTSGYVPLGGVIVGDRVAKVLIEQGGEFTHGFTYSGHPVACAAALENIRIIEDEQLVAKVADDTGPYLKQCFASLGEHPLVGYADSCGLVAGLNLVRKKGATVHENALFDEDQGVGMICRGHMFDNGVIMRAVGERMIVAPPLVMTRAQIDEMVALIRVCLDKTYADVKAKGWV